MSNMIAVIIEGERYEKGIIKNLQMNLISQLGHTESRIISLPASSNIYMLWQKMKEDEFVDIIEVIRELSEESERQLEGFIRDDFSEVYMFFDLDAHQQNLKSGENPVSVVKQMLDFFSNETDNGKLYISYPMAEAICDF